MDTSTGSIAFSVAIRSFEFDKKLMQEHFNEKYMESEKFPSATFSGKLQDFDPNTDARQSVIAEGKLTIHGVTRDVKITATLIRPNDTTLQASASFKVKLEDYKIKIPQILWQNIAEEVEITVTVTYHPK